MTKRSSRCILCAEIVPWLFLVKTSVRRARSASKAVCTTALNFTPIVPRTRCKSWSEYRTLRGRVWGTLSAASAERSTEQSSAERTSERFWMRKYVDSKIHRLDRWIVQTVTVALPAPTPALQVMNETCQPHNEERNANTEKRFSIAAAATSSCGSNPQNPKSPGPHHHPPDPHPLDLVGTENTSTSPSPSGDSFYSSTLSCGAGI